MDRVGNGYDGSFSIRAAYVGSPARLRGRTCSSGGSTSETRYDWQAIDSYATEGMKSREIREKGEQ